MSWILYKLNNLWSRIRMAWQRLTKGYADEEWWNLDYYTAEFIIPRLKQLRKHNHGCPAPFVETPDGEDIPNGEQNWYAILDKIIEGLETYEHKWNGDYDEDKWEEYYEKQAEAWKLFGEWAQRMWD